jgi:hypothetical protein
LEDCHPKPYQKQLVNGLYFYQKKFHFMGRSKGKHRPSILRNRSHSLAALKGPIFKRGDHRDYVRQSQLLEFLFETEFVLASEKLQSSQNRLLIVGENNGYGQEKAVM